MEKYKAVIDTCVIFAGLYSATGASYKLLELIDDCRIVPYLSTTLLFEYEEVLRRNLKRLHLSHRDLDDVLDGICNRVQQRPIHFLWRPQLPDPKDDHVLELAVACGCADIVTFNVRDFTASSLFGIRIVTPAMLLEDIS